MKGAGKTYGLLSETSTIEETRNPYWMRNLPNDAALLWLKLGWADLWRQPALSLLYGIGVFAVSILSVWLMYIGGWQHYLFPAVAGFMIVAPVLAAGLYAKSKALESGGHSKQARVFLVRADAGTHIIFTGLLLFLLLLLWMRAAVLVYALFFGISPFPGFDAIVWMLFTTPTGWAMLVVGSFIGSLFAALGFAVSVFSIPMLLDTRVDALTAMGTSVALVWNNLRPMLIWGVVVLALFLVCVATAFVGLIIVFPLLGHATWHAYRAVQRD